MPSNMQHARRYPGIVSELCCLCEKEDETFEHLVVNEHPCFNTYRREVPQGIPVIKTFKWKAITLIKCSQIPSQLTINLRVV